MGGGGQLWDGVMCGGWDRGWVVRGCGGEEGEVCGGVRGYGGGGEWG